MNTLVHLLTGKDPKEVASDFFGVPIPARREPAPAPDLQLEKNAVQPEPSMSVMLEKLAMDVESAVEALSSLPKSADLVDVPFIRPSTRPTNVRDVVATILGARG
jgi:hypothetical protein